MEKVALNNLQLDYLAGTHPILAQVFYGTVPCDRLPRTLPQEGPTAYIVNTDPHDEPGRHWIAIWTEGNVSEIMDSYGLSLEVYGTADPIVEWLNRHFKYQMHNGQSLQSLFSQSCGDYALMYLIDRAEGRHHHHHHIYLPYCKINFKNIYSMLLGEETSGNHQAYRRDHLDITILNEIRAAKECGRN